MSVIASLLVMGFGQFSLSQDTRLFVKASFDDSLMPISDFAKELSQATGVSISVDSDVADYKIDAFVRNRSVGETMANLADVFDLQWSKDVAGGYRLMADPTHAADERSYLQEEDRLAEKNLNHKIAVYRAIDALVPRSDKPWTDINRFGGWKDKVQLAQSELAKAKQLNASDETIENLAVTCEAMELISGGSPDLKMARLFGSMSSQDIEDYKAGVPFIVARYSDSKFNFSQGDVQSVTQEQKKKASFRIVIFTAVDPDTHLIGSKELAFTEGSFSLNNAPPKTYPFDHIPDQLAGLPLAARLKDWDESGSTKWKETTLDRNAGNQMTWNSPWYGNRYRLGDHLRWFSFMTGTPIILPANRTIHPFIKLNRGGITEKEYVSSLIRACGGYYKKNGDFLLVRDGQYWRKRVNEIPESVMAKMEAYGVDGGGLNDYAALAKKINHVQARLIQDYNGFVVKFQRKSMNEAYPVFPFYASLDDQQMNLANSKVGLSYSFLTEKQRRLFTSAVFDGLAWQGFANEQLLHDLSVYGLTSTSLERMYFSTKIINVISVFNAVTGVDMDESIVLIPATRTPQQNVNFQFGFNNSSLMTFTTRNIAS